MEWTVIKSENTSLHLSSHRLSLSDLVAFWPAGSPRLRLLHTKVHPCRQLTACPVPGQPLSGSCGNPSNRCARSHRPTESTSPCRSPTGGHRRSDMAGPAGGVCWRPVSFYWGNGTCSPHCRERTVIDYIDSIWFIWDFNTYLIWHNNKIIIETIINS